MNAERPVFLDLTRIRFPVGAVASMGHRVSGVVLAIALPLAVLALQRSLAGDALAFGGWMRVAAALLAWAAAHHLFAGIRHLLMEAGVGSSLHAARRSAYAALLAAALLLHAWVGVRDVVLDYFHPLGVRLVAHAL